MIELKPLGNLYVPSPLHRLHSLHSLTYRFFHFPNETCVLLGSFGCWPDETKISKHERMNDANAA